MAEGLRRKEGKRRGFRDVLVGRLREADDILMVVDGVDPVKLEQLRLYVNEKHSALKKLDEEILELLDDDEAIVAEITNADKFNDRIYESLAKIEVQMRGVSRVKARDHVSVSSSDIASKTKLPKLNLPVFKGNVTEWTTFWDLYNVAIHSNDSLSPVQKFTHLRTLVSHSAKDAIAGLTLSDANYDEAIKILKDRFGNREKIISKHMEELVNLGSLVVTNNNLRVLYDKIECHTRELRSLGVSEEAYNCLLPPLIMKKLPKELALSISRRIPEDEWNLSKIMSELSVELKARERTYEVSGNDDYSKHMKIRDESKYKHASHKRAYGPPTTSTLLSSACHCLYCTGAHEAEDCPKITKVEERKQVLRDTGRCFICTKQGHLSRGCRSSSKCKHCSGRHHSSICFKSSGSEKRDERSSKHGTSTLDPAATPFKTTTCLTDASEKILLQTAKATVRNPEGPHSLMLTLIFDSGSQRSFMTRRARERLALRTCGRKELFISTFGAKRSKSQLCDVVRATLVMRDGEELLLDLLTVPTICEPISCASNESIQQYEHLRGIELAAMVCDSEPIEFDVLIGLDHYWDIVTGEVIRGSSGPTAVHSHLGWILSGPTVTESDSIMMRTLATGIEIAEDKSRLEKQLRSFWELEALGISEQETTLYEQFKDHISFDGTRYEVTLPWKDNTVTLPDNYELSLCRLKGLLKRLRRNQDLLKEYDQSIRDQIENGVVEVVEDPALIEGERVHYLPHHAVVRQDKQTTKLRIVYDASAKSSGVSLNECLYVGPKFNQKIFEILIRFRIHRNGFIADVEKAFLMISVNKCDRDVLRFLWVKNPHQEPIEIQVLRFRRVTFGVTVSPFLLNATMRYHIESYEKEKPELVEKLLHSVYVDDVVCGTESAEKSIAMFDQFRAMLATGGFNLRKFVSAGCQTTDAGGEQKVLGVTWRVSSDELSIDLSSIAEKASVPRPTKRHVVSVTSQIYDPIGIVSPVTIRFKMFLQQLHCTKMDWDEEIRGELLDCWNSLISCIRDKEPIIVPRCCLGTVPDDCQWRLIGFSDSSVKAYSAVVYLQCITGNERQLSFIASKTRVAPMKSFTIPRLELLGALLLARLISCVHVALKEELVLLPSRCFTDSQVALYWIQGERREWKPFVYNRVREIRKLVPSSQWSHCSGKQNPADIPSRGMSIEELRESTLWWKGPKDLDIDQERCEQMPSECMDELRASERSDCILLAACESVGIANIIDIRRYSVYSQLISVTGYVLQFVERILLSVRGNTGMSKEFIVLRNEAEVMWIKEVQKELVKDKNFKQLKVQLQLFLDDKGVWRCGGRLANADLPFETKHPILLPGREYFTELIIRRAHEKMFHNGVKDTLNELRSRFWVLRGRAVVRKLIHNCVLCRRLEGQAYATPPMPPLPTYRVSEKPPFYYTGVDFAGPIFVKNSAYEVGGKAWLCLYTCCITRAIHLDLLHNMSFEYFFRSFKRFVARRGLPRKMLSDNAKTFKKMAGLLKEIKEHKDVKRYFVDYQVQWIFNVEKSPWWGGVFERLIRSVKRCMKKVIGRATLTHEELLTVVIEIEMILNSRPLSYITQDDLDEPITPSHILIGRRLTSLPDDVCCNEDEFTVTPPTLTKRMEFINRQLNHFWSRWRKEYLLELREAHRVNLHNSSERYWIQIGDVVVIHNDEKKRGFWSTGRVEELLTGRDGNIRAAVVRVYAGSRGSTLLKRPVQKLFPIEVHRDQEGTELAEETQLLSDDEEPTNDMPEDNFVVDNSRLEEINTVQDSVANEGDMVTNTRPKRAAAFAARDHIKAQSFM